MPRATTSATALATLLLGAVDRASGFAAWSDVEARVTPHNSQDEPPLSIDSVLDSSTPNFSSSKPTLFRERHGWCPYSERVWLTLEYGGIAYDEVRIDNTGGGRPSYYSGQTPQMRWPDGKTQGESMDLVYELDKRYDLGLKSDDEYVRECVREFSNIFPRARPSSRAAYLFQYNGEPLSKGTFEQTLAKANELIGKTDGNFFCGDEFTAADIAWAPFLERYRFQLPCLHQDLYPDDVFSYFHLSDWYTALEIHVPAYACRVQGDAASWRKVLNMAGFGNAGIPAELNGNIDSVLQNEDRLAREATRNTGKVMWSRYRDDGRDYLADTPSKQVALTIVRNRKAIVADALKQAGRGNKHLVDLGQDESAVDAALLELADALATDDLDKEFDEKNVKFESDSPAASMARFLDDRICVPRDMGAIPSGYLKVLANLKKEG